MEVTRLFDILDFRKANQPQRPVFTYKENGEWIKHSISEYISKSNLISCGLMELGIETSSVQSQDQLDAAQAHLQLHNMFPLVFSIILCFCEWNYIDMGVQQIGAVLVPIYPTISEEDYRFILNNAEVRYMIVEGEALLHKIQHIREHLPNLVEIYTIVPAEGAPSLQDIIDLGIDHQELDRLQDIKDSITTNDVATIIYTSGTTGFPKGVMLTHHNVVNNGKYIGDQLDSNDVGIYRQDSNGPGPLVYWQDQEAKLNDGRHGYVENLAVRGEFALWNEWRRRRPHMLFDTCASGGRRNDLSTLRFPSVPLHYTDIGYTNYVMKCRAHHMCHEWLFFRKDLDSFYHTKVVDGVRMIDRRKEMAWLQKAGIKGLKVDFIGSDKQQTMQMYEDMMVDANDYGLMMIFHGCTIPRGWERMFPNFVACEAARVSENLAFGQYDNDIEALAATIHPVLRNAIGNMDFGGSTLNKHYSKNNERGTTRKTSDVYALATAVLFQTPVQNFALTPNNLTDAPAWAVDFMKKVPTLWQDMKMIEGYPGKYIVMARQDTEGNWFLAGVNATREPMKVKLDVSMFAVGQEVSLYVNNEVKTIKVDNKLQKKGLDVVIPSDGGVVVK